MIGCIHLTSKNVSKDDLFNNFPFNKHCAYFWHSFLENASLFSSSNCLMYHIPAIICPHWQIHVSIHIGLKSSTVIKTTEKQKNRKNNKKKKKKKWVKCLINSFGNKYLMIRPLLLRVWTLYTAIFKRLLGILKRHVCIYSRRHAKSLWLQSHFLFTFSFFLHTYALSHSTFFFLFFSYLVMYEENFWIMFRKKGLMIECSKL